MNITSEITFALGQQPQSFSLHNSGSANPWRFLADKTAIVLVPFCDSLARTVAAPPLFDRLEIWPCYWGCPDFSRTNPVEYAELKRRFLAGEFPPDDIPMPPPDERGQYWPNFLRDLGNAILWGQCATDDLKKHWLNTFEDYTGPGFKLFNLAQTDPYQPPAEPTILRKNLERIQFRADFCNGNSRQTVYLADCKPDLLTIEEQRHSPSFIAQEQKRVRHQKELAIAETKSLAQKKKLSAQDTQLAKKHAAEAKKNLPWHSEGFGIIFRYNGKGKKEDELTLTPVFRALCQILSEQPEQRAWFGKIEPLIGPRARKFDEDEGRGTMAESPGHRRLRDLLKERQGITLQKWKVLVVEPAGQRKFLKLLPPKSVK